MRLWRYEVHSSYAVEGSNFFFNSHSVGGVQSGPTRYVCHFWPIVPAPGDCEDGEFGGMKTGRRNRSTWRQSAQCYFVHHKSHLTKHGRETGPPRWEASY
jgi:hypothetical protein